MNYPSFLSIEKYDYLCGLFKSSLFIIFSEKLWEIVIIGSTKSVLIIEQIPWRWPRWGKIITVQKKTMSKYHDFMTYSKFLWKNRIQFFSENNGTVRLVQPSTIILIMYFLIPSISQFNRFLLPLQLPNFFYSYLCVDFISPQCTVTTSSDEKDTALHLLPFGDVTWRLLAYWPPMLEEYDLV